jgi:hypothetical protein
MERLLNKRLLSYLNKYYLISESQYGFRKKISTEDAVKDLTSLIVSQVNKNKKCLTVFLDLKKAFDTVSVPILLQRMEHYGVRGEGLSLLTSYLKDRKQTVKIDSHISGTVDINYGVPQGSVLGPTLFLIYINELCKMEIENGQIFAYADDTALVFTGDTWDSVKRSAESGLAKIAKWLNLKLLTLNVSKTNFICFSKYNSTQPDLNFEIKIHSCPTFMDSQCYCPKIAQLSNVKYLGVILDRRLSWYSHLQLMTARLRKLIWVFKSLRHVCSRSLLNKIYVSLAQSVLSYCISIWGGAAKTRFLDLERAQRSLMKVMYFKPYRYSTTELYIFGDLLSVRKLYVLNVVLQTHKSTTFQPQLVSKRRKYKIPYKDNFKSKFACRQYSYRSILLFNSINDKRDIYLMKYHDCKKAVIDYLTQLTYDEIEDIIA